MTDLRSLPQDNLTPKKFEGLLLRLSSDRNHAGQRYEEIRWKLIKYFQWNSCLDAEDLVDETFDRVAQKLISCPEEIQDVVAYLWGVAKKVRQEVLRKETRTVRLPDLPDADGLIVFSDLDSPEAPEAKRRLKCLRRCIQSLSAFDRSLLLKYYSSGGRRVEGRLRLAQENGITIVALRVRANRLRFKLGECIKKCLSVHSRLKTTASQGNKDQEHGR